MIVSRIKIGSANHVITLRADSQKLALQWFEILFHDLNTTTIPKQKIASIPFYLFKVNYKKYNNIKEKDFIFRAETGDILLFSGQTFFCKVQRFVTRSRFGKINIDHVAFVLKCTNGEILLCEATGSCGVGITEWRNFRKLEWYTQQKLIVYRRLELYRTKKDIQTIENTLKQVVGKKYNINIFSLFSNQLNLDSTKNLSSKKGFFCSELVATFYKALGLLPIDLSSSHYWPGQINSFFFCG